MNNDKLKLTQNLFYPITVVDTNETKYKKVTGIRNLSNYSGVILSISKEPFGETDSPLLVDYSELSKLPTENDISAESIV